MRVGTSNITVETDSVILNYNETDPKKYIFVEKECNVSLFVIFLFEAETIKNILTIILPEFIFADRQKQIGDKCSRICQKIAKFAKSN